MVLSPDKTKLPARVKGVEVFERDFLVDTLVAVPSYIERGVTGFESEKLDRITYPLTIGYKLHAPNLAAGQLNVTYAYGHYRVEKKGG